MVELSQVVEIPRSRDLLPLVIFEVVGALPSKLGYIVGSFPIWAEVLVRRVLGVSNNLPQDEISK